MRPSAPSIFSEEYPNYLGKKKSFLSELEPTKLIKESKKLKTRKEIK